jgi:hypothetical protein
LPWNIFSGAGCSTIWNMPQASQNAGASSKKYSSLISASVRNPFAIGMRPNVMKGKIAPPHARQTRLALVMNNDLGRDQPAKILAVGRIGDGGSEAAQACVVDEAHAKRNFLRAADLQALTLFESSPRADGSRLRAISTTSES